MISPNELNKAPGTNPGETEISDLSGREFKIEDTAFPNEMMRQVCVHTHP